MAEDKITVPFDDVSEEEGGCCLINGLKGMYNLWEKAKTETPGNHGTKMTALIFLVFVSVPLSPGSVFFPGLIIGNSSASL